MGAESLLSSVPIVTVRDDIKSLELKSKLLFNGENNILEIHPFENAFKTGLTALILKENEIISVDLNHEIKSSIYESWSIKFRFLKRCTDSEWILIDRDGMVYSLSFQFEARVIQATSIKRWGFEPCLGHCSPIPNIKIPVVMTDILMCNWCAMRYTLVEADCVAVLGADTLCVSKYGKLLVIGKSSKHVSLVWASTTSTNITSIHSNPKNHLQLFVFEGTLLYVLDFEINARTKVYKVKNSKIIADFKKGLVQLLPGPNSSLIIAHLNNSTPSNDIVNLYNCNTTISTKPFAKFRQPRGMYYSLPGMAFLDKGLTPGNNNLFIFSFWHTLAVVFNSCPCDYFDDYYYSDFYEESLPSVTQWSEFYKHVQLIDSEDFSSANNTPDHLKPNLMVQISPTCSYHVHSVVMEDVCPMLIKNPILYDPNVLKVSDDTGDEDIYNQVLPLWIFFLYTGKWSSFADEHTQCDDIIVKKILLFESMCRKYCVTIYPQHEQVVNSNQPFFSNQTTKSLWISSLTTSEFEELQSSICFAQWINIFIFAFHHCDENAQDYVFHRMKILYHDPYRRSLTSFVKIIFDAIVAFGQIYPQRVVQLVQQFAKIVDAPIPEVQVLAFPRSKYPLQDLCMLLADCKTRNILWNDSLLGKNKSCDFKITLNEVCAIDDHNLSGGTNLKTFNCHAHILAARWRFFENAVKFGGVESQARTLDMSSTSLSSGSLKVILEYFYTRKLFNASNVSEDELTFAHEILENAESIMLTENDKPYPGTWALINSCKQCLDVNCA
jgi:hypothetical protein